MMASALLVIQSTHIYATCRVSAIDGSQSGQIISGCYDGMLRIWDGKHWPALALALALALSQHEQQN